MTIFKLPPKPKGIRGTVGHSTVIERTEKDRSKTTLYEKAVSRPVEAPLSDLQAMGKLGEGGFSLGVTVPGPKNSYMTARVDAWGSLPCEPNIQAVRAAMTACRKEAEEELSIAMEEDVAVFFNALNGQG